MKKTELKILQDKYWDGTSSLEEEKQLQYYYLENADEDNPLSALLSYYNEERKVTYTKKVEAPPVKGKVISMNMLLSIAATMILLFAAYFSFGNTKQKNSDVVIDDPQVALQITKDAFALINGKMDKGSEAIKHGINHLDKTFIFKTNL
jgi:hypothetical protein